MKIITTIGIDVAKNSFSVYGVGTMPVISLTMCSLLTHDIQPVAGLVHT